TGWRMAGGQWRCQSGQLSRRCACTFGESRLPDDHVASTAASSTSQLLALALAKICNARDVTLPAVSTFACTYWHTSLDAFTKRRTSNQIVQARFARAVTLDAIPRRKAVIAVRSSTLNLGPVQALHALHTENIWRWTVIDTVTLGCSPERSVLIHRGPLQVDE